MPEQKQTSPDWGGKREGAGRKPPPGGRRKGRVFMANDPEWERICENAAKGGYANVSEYIRARTLPK